MISVDRVVNSVHMHDASNSSNQKLMGRVHIHYAIAT